MSDSRNARSKYQTVPDYVIASLSVKSERPRLRARDSRGSDKHALRIVVKGIGTTDVRYHDDTDGGVA